MSKKKIRRLCLALSMAFVLVCGGFAFSGAVSEDESGAGAVSAASGQSAVYHLDIVQAVAQQAANRSTLYDGVSSSMASRYQMILNGSGGDCYYLLDVTGDGAPELMAGEGILTVYTYRDGEIRSLGTVSGTDLHYSAVYGILAQELLEGSYQLRSYRYDTDLLMSSVLVSERSLAQYEEKAKAILSGADSLVSFEMSDRSALGG